MLAVKKLSTNFIFLSCLKMGLFFSWNVDDSRQSGGPKDRAPHPRMAQTGVSPQHPVRLHWLVPSEPLNLNYHSLSMKCRQTTLAARLSVVSVFTDLSSNMLVNCLWDIRWIPQLCWSVHATTSGTCGMTPAKWPHNVGPSLAWRKQAVFT